MTTPKAVATGTMVLRPSADGRLLPYCLIALGGLTAAVVVGQASLAALALPFALALTVGLRRTSPVQVRARVSLDSDQVLEGDLLTGHIELEWDGEFDAEVMLHRLRGVESVSDDALAWSLPGADAAVTVPIQLRTTRWGRHTVGEVWVRLTGPLGILSWTGRIVAGPTVRVLPGTERVTHLLEPLDLRTVMGAHRSRRVGAGGEFAQLRPYVPGDRLRDLNWSATARHGRPFVNRYHPELSGEVVIAIDAFADGSMGSTEALSRAARAAWALASIHLRANDRVGLAGLGGVTRWLPPAGGRFARYRILENLLRIGGEAAHPMAPRPGHDRAIPATALIVALTPLHDALTVRTLQAWRGRGRTVAVVVIDTSDLLDEPTSEADALARRLWLLGLDRRKRELTALGIPVLTVAADDAMTPTVTALRRARRGPTVRRG